MVWSVSVLALSNDFEASCLGLRRFNGGEGERGEERKRRANGGPVNTFALERVPGSRARRADRQIRIDRESYGLSFTHPFLGPHPLPRQGVWPREPSWLDVFALFVLPFRVFGPREDNASGRRVGGVYFLSARGVWFCQFALAVPRNRRQNSKSAKTSGTHGVVVSYSPFSTGNCFFSRFFCFLCVCFPPRGGCLLIGHASPSSQQLASLPSLHYTFFLYFLCQLPEEGGIMLRRGWNLSR